MKIWTLPLISILSLMKLFYTKHKLTRTNGFYVV